MKRIMIIGCGGAGKSTLARKLAPLSGLPLVHLDQHFWQPNWQEIAKSEWKRIVQQKAAEEQWIMDGNYGGTMDLRLERADTVLFLDFPPLLCLMRVLKRWWQYRGQSRPDMPPNCPERLSWDFIHYILRYRLSRSPGIRKKLSSLPKEVEVRIFTRPKEVQAYLNMFVER